MLQNIQLLAGQRRFESIRETDEKLILIAGGRARDDTHRTARMNQRIIRSPHFDQRHDLCPGKNVVRLM